VEIIGGLYFLIFLILSGAVYFYPVLNLKNQKKFSIIIPFRNERDYIEKNYRFIISQKYEKDNFEILYVNDHSTDGCENLIDFENANLIDLKKKEKGKFEALKKGSEKSKFDYLVLTDADSYGNEEYFNSFNQVINEEDCLYAGFFEIEDSAVFSLDSIFLVGIAAALNHLNLPASCPGANLCVKKNIFKDFADYIKNKNLLTEDALLFNWIQKEKSCGIHFIFDKRNIIKTRGYDNIKDFINQRIRWLKGGYNISLTLLIFLLFIFISHILFLFNIVYLIVPFISILLFVLILLKKLKRTKYLIYYPLFFIYFYLYTVFIGVLFIFSRKKIRWKGRSY